MANRRMLSKAIILTDSFLSLPATAQNLYFHLNLVADDDGFVSLAKGVMGMTGNTDDDLNCLCDNGFLVSFPSGVIAIVHWHIHNQIRRDRYHPTLCQAEKESLASSLETEIRSGEDSLEKSSPDDENTLDLDMFYSFWNAYPRKENQADARKTWQSLHISHTVLKEILNAISWQKNSRKWTEENGKFIPLPANWLRNEAWKDEPPLVQKPADEYEGIDFTTELEDENDQP